MSEAIRVGMSEIVVAKAPKVLVTLGLGSCVAVCIYDFFLKAGGMAHIMLPDSSLSSGSRDKVVTNRGKFADTAIPDLFEALRQEGALKERMVVKIAGGAQMFAFSDVNNTLQIGARNIEAVEKILAEMGLKITNRSVGGNVGRSVYMDLETGGVRIKMLNSPEIIL
ncbi:MAG: chemotaxis protein CheD [Firmicutes bacterium]|nr:chemotaxis protein CheD [Bacillota bacterium]